MSNEPLPADLGDDAGKTAPALIAAAGALVPMVAALTAKGDEASRTDAALLQRGINQMLDEATIINAESVIAALAGNAPAQRALKKLTRSAQTAASEIAKDEGRVKSAISFCTSVVSFGIALTTGNAAEAVSALECMLGALKIG